jgi:hypothetical protein
MEVETLVGREHSEKEKHIDTVLRAAEQWARECLGNGVQNEDEKKVRVRHRPEPDYRRYRSVYLCRAVQVEGG